MGLLNAAAILAADDLAREKVDVPEWGADAFVFVRALTAAERDEWESTLFIGEGDKRAFDQKNVRARLAARCICDDKGGPLFTAAQAEALGRKSAKALGRIFDVAQRLNGIGAEAEADAKKA